VNVSKGARTRAAERAMKIAAQVEAHIAGEAKATLTEKPGLNRQAVEQLYADELTRLPLPNRAMRRRAGR
jgi:hypothetical protein